MKEIHPENQYFLNINEDMHHLADFKIEKIQRDNGITGQPKVIIQKLVEFDETDIKVPFHKCSGLINMKYLKNVPKMENQIVNILSQSLNENSD